MGALTVKVMTDINTFIIKHAAMVVVAIFLLILAAFTQMSNFKIDASADSLMLENDLDLAFYREVNERYGATDFLLVTFTPKQGVFHQVSLAQLKNLKTKLLTM